LDEAEKLFLRAIKLNPNNFIPYNNLGTVYTEKGEYIKALPFYLNSYNLNPNFAPVAYNISNIYMFLGNMEESKRFRSIGDEIKKR
ncbi:type IV pilus biogenesis/stability protein PilW, partial [Thermodesulfobacteriota bacterium]